jgi:hypothetical protein
MAAISSRRIEVASSARIAAATVALAALLLAAALLLLYAGRRLTFFYDEWAFILGRRGGALHTYLDPHNGHFSLFPVAVYKLLFATVGLRHYTPYRLVGIVLHVLCATLLYVLARRRLGPAQALVPTALLLFMGTAFQDLLWPFQIGFLGSVAGGLGALALLEGEGRRTDMAAAALLVWSVSSSGAGVAFVVACAVALLARGTWRRLWIVGVPAGVFLVWYLGWGSSEHVTTDAVVAAPQYVANAAAGAVAGIAGFRDLSWGPPLAVALLAGLAVAWRRRGLAQPTPMLLAAAAGALTFWGLSALIRSDSPDPAASRYLYIGAVFIFLIAAEAGAAARIRGTWQILAALVVGGALIGNLGVLRAGERGMRGADNSVRAALGAVEIAAPVVSPGFAPSPRLAPQVAAGPYLAAVHDLGSPALTVPELERAPGSMQMTADQTLVLGERLGAAHAGAGSTSSCAHALPLTRNAPAQLSANPGTTVTIAVPAGHIATAEVRRFAAAFQPAPLALIRGGTAAAIAFPADRAPQVAWHLRLLSSAPLAVCMT